MNEREQTQLYETIGPNWDRRDFLKASAVAGGAVVAGSSGRVGDAVPGIESTHDGTAEAIPPVLIGLGGALAGGIITGSFDWWRSRGDEDVERLLEDIADDNLETTRQDIYSFATTEDNEVSRMFEETESILDMITDLAYSDVKISAAADLSAGNSEAEAIANAIEVVETELSEVQKSVWYANESVVRRIMIFLKQYADAAEAADSGMSYNKNSAGAEFNTTPPLIYKGDSGGGLNGHRIGYEFIDPDLIPEDEDERDITDYFQTVTYETYAGDEVDLLQSTIYIDEFDSSDFSYEVARFGVYSADLDSNDPEGHTHSGYDIHVRYPFDGRDGGYSEHSVDEENDALVIPTQKLQSLHEKLDERRDFLISEVETMVAEIYSNHDPEDFSDEDVDEIIGAFERLRNAVLDYTQTGSNTFAALLAHEMGFTTQASGSSMKIEYTEAEYDEEDNRSIDSANAEEMFVYMYNSRGEDWVNQMEETLSVGDSWDTEDYEDTEFFLLVEDDVDDPEDAGSMEFSEEIHADGEIEILGFVDTEGEFHDDPEYEVDMWLPDFQTSRSDDVNEQLIEYLLQREEIDTSMPSTPGSVFGDGGGLSLFLSLGVIGFLLYLLFGQQGGGGRGRRRY